MTRVPRVSVGMPVYNGEVFLAWAIESILSQTFIDFELIISDNASTDSTEAICQNLAAKDQRIKYYRNDHNLGAAGNFNRVFELSRGEYFKWATADDLCAPDYLQRCVETLDYQSDVVLCYGKTKYIDETGRTISTYEDGLNLVSSSASGRFLQVMYNASRCNPICGVIRSNVLRKTRLIGSYIGSDKCLLAELSLLGKFREIPDYLFFRRVHPGSSSAKKDNESQLLFFDPKRRGQVVLPTWRHFFEHLKSIRRAPVKWSQKMLPLSFLLGSLVVSHRRYLAELVTATRQLVSRRPKPFRAVRAKTTRFMDV